MELKEIGKKLALMIIAWFLEDPKRIACSVVIFITTQLVMALFGVFYIGDLIKNNL